MKALNGPRICLGGGGFSRKSVNIQPQPGPFIYLALHLGLGLITNVQCILRVRFSSHGGYSSLPNSSATPVMVFKLTSNTSGKYLNYLHY